LVCGKQQYHHVIRDGELMPLAALAGTLISLHASAACPDLTGRYAIQSEDGRVFVSIQQVACERATVHWDIQSYDGRSGVPSALTLDGRFRPDSGWFGGGRQLSAARFNGDTLEIVARPHTSRDSTSVSWRLWLHPIPGGDLCTLFSHLDGDVGGIIAARIGPLGADEAANRASARLSGPPCAQRKSSKQCGVGPLALTGDGIGELRVGRTVASVREQCRVLEDKQLPHGNEGHPERRIKVVIAGSVFDATVVDDRVWRIEVLSAHARTRDSLGVGTTARELQRRGARPPSYGEGGVYTTIESMCGLSFRLGGLQHPVAIKRGWQAIPPDARVDLVLMFGCR
jgi:hypothetical protein